MNPPVFISYSRKDFYFAESLAFHLTERGIENWLDANHLTPGHDWSLDIERALDDAQIIIAVLSCDSAGSEYVRREWQCALEQGHRIILVQFRSFAPPAELHDAELIDFRGRFRPALKKLIAALGSAKRVTPAQRRMPRLPPLIFFYTLALLLISLVPLMVFATWDPSEITREPQWERILIWICLPFFFAFLAWHMGIAFLRRRMRMTRLALTISFFTGLFGIYLLGRLGVIESVHEAMRGTIMTAPVSLLVAIVGRGLIALAGVIFFRPQDLLRWWWGMACRRTAPTTSPSVPPGVGHGR